MEDNDIKYNFKNKVVLITGSSRSLGKEIALNFAKSGACVVINYNNSMERAKELKNELKEMMGEEPLLIKCDVSKENEVKSMVNEVTQKYGKIDILVNNAGICNDTLFDEKTYDDFSKVIGVNLIGTYLVSKHVCKNMMEKGYGKVINISSDNGLLNGYPESAEYDASKAGIISLTHNMAKFYAPYINVNCICPGWIDTDMNKDLSKRQKDEICDSILLNRFATADEIAKTVMFLASNDASYINDSIIKINGGSK